MEIIRICICKDHVVIPSRIILLFLDDKMSPRQSQFSALTCFTVAIRKTKNTVKSQDLPQGEINK